MNVPLVQIGTLRIKFGKLNLEMGPFRIFRLKHKMYLSVQEVLIYKSV